MRIGSAVVAEEFTAPLTIQVGERCFRVCLGGPGGALEVETSTGESIRLLPWTLNEHLEALDRHVDAGGGRIRFDDAGFARDVLARSCVLESFVDELAPLALWWAVGGEPDNRIEVVVGWVEAGQGRVRLRKWTFVEREKALSASVATRSTGAKEFSLARYLRAMLEASVVALDPPGSLDMLDGATATALLDAVTSLNGDEVTDADRMVQSGEEAGRALAEATLRICRALGWTPSQVWATPAIEIDRIMALLDRVEPRASTARPSATGSQSLARQPTMADYPDAVVIHVEDG